MFLLRKIFRPSQRSSSLKTEEKGFATLLNSSFPTPTTRWGADSWRGKRRKKDSQAKARFAPRNETEERGFSSPKPVSARNEEKRFTSLLKPDLSSPDYGAMKDEFVRRKVTQKELSR
jgi:hypothetical protein